MISGAAAIDVLGSLEVESPNGRSIVVEGHGDRVTVRLSLATVVGLGLAALRSGATATSAVATHLGLAVDVRVGGVLQARFRPDLRPGALSRLVGWPPFQLALLPAGQRARE